MLAGEKSCSGAGGGAAQLGSGRILGKPVAVLSCVARLQGSRREI